MDVPVLCKNSGKYAYRYNKTQAQREQKSATFEVVHGRADVFCKEGPVSLAHEDVDGCAVTWRENEEGGPTRDPHPGPQLHRRVIAHRMVNIVSGKIREFFVRCYHRNLYFITNSIISTV